MTAFWPGALTIIMKRNEDFHSLALSGGQTAALRAPAHGLVRELIHALGEPMTGTSANRSGNRPPVSAQEIAFQLGQLVALVIDGGSAARGVESTIIDITGDSAPVISRSGAIGAEEIERAIGVSVISAEDAR
jgi:L-threonylcarbamoyladenylate synthase